MKYWWQKCEGGFGITPVSEASYYRVGREIHTDLALLAEGLEWDEISLRTLPPDLSDQIAQEEWCRRMGWIACILAYVEPWTKERFENVLIEGDLVLDRTPLWIRCIPDRLMRDRRTGQLVYREYKSAAWFSKTWAAHWPTAIQQHIGLKAIEEEFPPSFHPFPRPMGQVMGLLKGEIKYGKLSHPYVYAYRSPQGEWTHKYHSSWEKIGVWEYPGGIDGWVLHCGPEVAARVIHWSEPIYCDDRLLESMVRRLIERMEQVEQWKGASQTDKGMRELVFEQRFERCRPSIGAPCSYLDACHNYTVNEDPVGSGLFIPRTPDLDFGVDDENIG